MSIKSTTTYSETLVSSRDQVEVKAGSRVFDATPIVRDEALVVSIATVETCRTSTIETYRKIEHVTREVDPDGKDLGKFHPGYPIATGAVFFGLGALVYANADSIAAQPTDSGQMSSPDGIHSAGLLIGAIGVPLVVVGVVDLLRLRDSQVDVGEVHHESEAATASCNRRHLANQHLTLAADKTEWSISSRSNERGVVSFSLKEMPEAAFRQDVSELSLTLQVADEVVPITIETDAAKQLRDALEADPNSRLATDRAAAKAASDAKLAEAKQALAACQALVGDPSGGLARATSCWNSHADVLRALGATGDVPACLASIVQEHEKAATCLSASEKSDDDAMEKLNCLQAPSQQLAACGPINVEKLRAADAVTIEAARRKLQPRVDKIIARREQAAAAEAERKARKEAAAKKESARCGGNTIIQVVLAIHLGRVDPDQLRSCHYAVGYAQVETTTRDGWMIVSVGAGGAGGDAALQSRKRHADGSFLRDGTATFAGLQVFNRVDGGTATIPAFRFFE